MALIGFLRALGDDDMAFSLVRDVEKREVGAVFREQGRCQKGESEKWDRACHGWCVNSTCLGLSVYLVSRNHQWSWLESIRRGGFHRLCLAQALHLGRADFPMAGPLTIAPRITEPFG